MWRAYRGWFDLVGIVAVAVVFLFPAPGVTVLHALPRAGTHELDRIAELEARMMGHPDDVDAGLELADLYSWQWRPEWALATLGPLAERHPDDFRLHFALAVQHADRYDFPSAQSEIDTAERVCLKNDGPRPCTDSDQVRMKVFAKAIGDVLAQNVNPLKDPNRAKEIIDSAMHMMKIPRPGEEAHRLFPPPPAKKKPEPPKK